MARGVGVELLIKHEAKPSALSRNETPTPTTRSLVSVQSSPGVGVTLFNVAEKVDIENCTFLSNMVPPNKRDRYPGGAGLYVEFNYCDPGVVDANCDHPEGYNTYSEYTISNSIFALNNASDVPTKTSVIKPQGLDHQAFG